MEHRESDLGCAGFLLAAGHRLVGLQELGRSGRLAFVFENSNNSAADAATDYFNGASVCALDFAHGLREAKGLVRKHLPKRGVDRG